MLVVLVILVVLDVLVVLAMPVLTVVYDVPRVPHVLFVLVLLVVLVVPRVPLVPIMLFLLFVLLQRRDGIARAEIEGGRRPGFRLRTYVGTSCESSSRRCRSAGKSRLANNCIMTVSPEILTGLERARSGDR